MKTAKLFQNGHSQAVRLPKEFRFAGDCVYIRKMGEGVLLLPASDPWREMYEAAKRLAEDFPEERDQGFDSPRESFD